MIISLFGFLGATFFSICAIPQAWQVWKTQDAKSLSLSFLILWILGEIFMWLYVILQNISVHVMQWPLHINYLINGILLVYLVYKKITLKSV